MPRIARIVIPHYPHHITQRGNRRQSVFFNDEDYIFYKKTIAAALCQAQVALWAYCLMPNHVHLVVVPETEGGCAIYSARHIAITLVESIFEKDGVAIYGRSVFIPL